MAETAEAFCKTKLRTDSASISFELLPQLGVFPHFKKTAPELYFLFNTCIIRNSTYISVPSSAIVKEASYSRWELMQRPTAGQCAESERFWST